MIVHSMDRLARNLDDLRRIVETLTRRGVQVRFMREALTFTGNDSPMSNLLLSMLGAVAQFERDLLLERQREGIAIAKSNGAYRGRPNTLKDADALAILDLVEAGIPKTIIGKRFGVTRNTIRKYHAAAQAAREQV